MGTYSVQLPLDDDGFLRRECPNCLKEFKWYYGPTSGQPEGEADPPVYYCPLCGASAAPDQWWTQEQLVFMADSAVGPALREVSEQLENGFRGLKGLTYRRGQIDEPEPPTALHEPNDMTMVAPPCHSREPVKVPEEATTRVYCLMCGEAFAA
jgi:ribosomal protein S27E